MVLSSNAVLTVVTNLPYVFAADFEADCKASRLTTPTAAATGCGT